MKAPITINRRIAVISCLLSSLLLPLILKGAAQPLEPQEESLQQQLSDARAQRLLMIEQQDPQVIIPRMRSAYNNLTRLRALRPRPIEAIATQERELAILTQQYMKELSPQHIEALRQSTRSIQSIKRRIRSKSSPTEDIKTDIFDTLLL